MSLLFNEIVVYEKKLDFDTARQKAEEYTAMFPEDETAAKELEFLKSREKPAVTPTPEVTPAQTETSSDGGYDESYYDDGSYDTGYYDDGSYDESYYDESYYGYDESYYDESYYGY